LFDVPVIELPILSGVSFPDYVYALRWNLREVVQIHLVAYAKKP